MSFPFHLEPYWRSTFANLVERERGKLGFVIHFDPLTIPLADRIGCEGLKISIVTWSLADRGRLRQRLTVSKSLIQAKWILLTDPLIRRNY